MNQPENSGCCIPQGPAATGRVGLSISAKLNPAPDAPGPEHHASLIELPGGTFQMGYAGPEAFPKDGEGPVRQVTIDPFAIDAYCVDNRRFKAFVDATGYRTEAEQFGSSFVFHAHLPPKFAKSLARTRAVVGLEWWLSVPGATWKHPLGPKSDLDGLWDHPVVHVSWNDAQAYAQWAGLSLPTEAQWEYAARGGLVGQHFPWGDTLQPNGRHACNVWQGRFPEVDLGEDGYKGTCPVNAYQPNGFGLYNVSGNVWEWTQEWFSPVWHQEESPATRVNPQGPDSSDRRLQKGGSFLCHKSYCNRYRVSARMGNTPDSSAANAGFRCVKNRVG